MNSKIENFRAPYTKEEMQLCIDTLNKYNGNIKETAQELTPLIKRTQISTEVILYKYKAYTRGEFAKISPTLLPLFQEVEPNKENDIHVTNGIAQISQRESTLQERTQKMEEAFQAFINSLIDVATAKSEQETKQKLEDQKKDYEAKLAHYQKLLVVAQESNMVGFVKKRLGLS